MTTSNDKLETTVLPFQISIPWMCEHYLQKHYENLVLKDKSSNKEYITFKEYNHIYVYPLYTEFRKNDLDLEKLLNTFVMEILQFDGKDFTLNDYVLSSYAQWVFDNYFATRESYLKTVDVRLKKKRIKDDLEFNKESGYKGYVYNKETEITYFCNFGEHWLTVTEILIREFGANFVQDKNNYPKLDKYITDNLELYGNFYGEKHYTTACQDVSGIELLNYNARLERWKKLNSK